MVQNIPTHRRCIIFSLAPSSPSPPRVASEHVRAKSIHPSITPMIYAASISAKGLKVLPQLGHVLARAEISVPQEEQAFKVDFIVVFFE